MKNLLTSTALAAALISMPALAATHVGLTYGDGRAVTEPVYGDPFMVDREYQYPEGYALYEDELTVDDITGAPLYSKVTGDRIGSVDDVIASGASVQAIVAEVGGFLGIGDSYISVPTDQVTVAREGGLGDTRVYINATEEQLEGYPRYEYQRTDLGTAPVAADDTMMADDDATTVVVTDEDAVATDETVVVAQTDTMSDGVFMRRDGTQVAAPVYGDDFMVDPDYRVDGYERFTGTYDQFLDEAAVEEARLYSAVTGEEIGEVEDAIEENGVVTALVLDIGGFLGIAEHTITVRPDQVSYQRDPGLLSDVRVYINATQEQLEAYPSYNADL